MTAAKRFMHLLDRAVDRLVNAGLVLVLPLSMLLFLQWPLRDLIGSYSREANDLAQILFAFYVTLAITYATRHRAHLAADGVARRYAPAVRILLARIGAACALVPWSAYLLYAAAPIVAQSVSALEGFPETFNPGYWLIKLSLGLLALLVLLQALRDVFVINESPDSWRE